MKALSKPSIVYSVIEWSPDRGNCCSPHSFEHLLDSNPQVLVECCITCARAAARQYHKTYFSTTSHGFSTECHLAECRGASTIARNKFARVLDEDIAAGEEEKEKKI